METLEKFIKYPETRLVSLTNLVLKEGVGLEILIKTENQLLKFSLDSDIPITISEITQKQIYQDPLTEVYLKPITNDSGLRSSYWLYIRTTVSCMILSIRPLNQVNSFNLELTQI